MSFLIVGLGNPGEKYEESRHNVGRMVIETFCSKNKFSDWEFDKRKCALISSGKIGKEEVILVLPETFMNKSGKAVLDIVSKHKIKPQNVVVVYDDLDLPLGKMKISFNRSAGGHRGLLSIEKSLKTRKFIRVRIGITPSTKTGKLKKPQGEEQIISFILGKFKKPEAEELKKVYKKAMSAIESIVQNGLEKAMGEHN